MIGDQQRMFLGILTQRHFAEWHRQRRGTLWAAFFTYVRLGAPISHPNDLSGNNLNYLGFKGVFKIIKMLLMEDLSHFSTSCYNVKPSERDHYFDL